MLRLGSAAGLSVPVSFNANGKEVNKYFTPHNLVDKYGLTEGSYVFMNDRGYMGDETWTEVVAVLAPVIQKMPVILEPVLLFYVLERNGLEGGRSSGGEGLDHSNTVCVSSLFLFSFRIKT